MGRVAGVRAEHYLGAMGLDARTEDALTRFVGELRAVLGETLRAAALYGSAVGDDWVRGRSDINVVVVVDPVDASVLDLLAPVVRRWRRHGGALPLVIDPAFPSRAADVFPMELADLTRHHRMLLGPDPFLDVTISPAARRRECEQEARGKLLRLRASYLECAASPRRLEEVLLGSCKSFVTLLRHLAELARGSAPMGFAAVLALGEELVGPLPTMRRLLAHRSGAVRQRRRTLRTEFPPYLEEVARIVAYVDALR